MTEYLPWFSAFILLLGLFSLGFAWVTIHQYRKRRDYLEMIIRSVE